MGHPRPLCVLVLLTFASVVHAADLAGTWQGTLKAGRDLRVVFTVTQADGGGLTATMRSIDQGGQAFAAQITSQAEAVRITLPGIGATFEGKVASDGRSITGTWVQAGTPFPLVLTRATAETAWALPAAPAPLAPMAADAPLRFEVATIKPSQPGAQGKLITMKGRQVITVNTSLSDLITFAYDLHPAQLEGGAEWLTSRRFDVTAQPEAPGQPNMVQLKAMVEALVTDRFRLTVHKDRRVLPAYVITVGDRPHKLTRSAGNPDGLPGLLFQKLGVLPALNASMSDFAGVLQIAVLDRPVVDRTALTGRWDFTLTWTPDESQFRSLGARVPPPPADGSGPPGLFTAIQEQLGLRLESTNAPAEVLVIDRAELPTEN